MKKIILFVIFACVLIGTIYSESFQEYQQRIEKEQQAYADKKQQELEDFEKTQKQELEKFIKNRELDFKKFWGVVNEESFADTKERSEDEEPPAFKAKFSVCFNCADSGADLQVASEDQNGTFIWEAAKNSCEKRGDGWYLPTREELRKVYELKKEMGGFSDAEYWSLSSEVVSFKDGNGGSCKPSEAKRVRCVRRMPDSQSSTTKVIVKNNKPVKNDNNKVKSEPDRPTNVFIPDKFIWPVENYCRRVITSNFGERQNIIKGKVAQGKGSHHGIDIACLDQNIEGKPVIAAAAGKVVYAGFDKGKNKSYGNYIRIEHPDGRRTIYGHLSEITVKQGDNVMQGQEVGKAGKTGFVTGPHLHFEIRRQDVAQDPLKDLPKTNIILKK